MSRNRPNKQPRENQEAESDSGAERLQKVLASAGVGSRRDCEELIEQGRVEVDKVVVTELGTRVDPLRQEIRVDGTALRQPKRVYYALNKPEGVVSTNYDQSGRTRIIDLLPNEERLFPVGRIDRSSEGLILVTNDGAFANRLTHPRYGVEKTYVVRVAGSPGEKELLRLRKGIHLSDGLAKVVSLRVKGRHKQSTDLEIILNEGKNREIRRILARVGHKVLSLKRTAIGTMKLGELPSGAWRKLMPQEVNELMSLAKRKRKEAPRGPRQPTAVAAATPAIATGAGSHAEHKPVREGRVSAGGVRENRSFAKPVKPPQGKRPTSTYSAPAARMPPPPADDLLRLEDFLPPLQDDEGDEIDLPEIREAGVKPGRVLEYGDEPGQAPAAAPQPPMPKPDLRDRGRSTTVRKANQRKPGRKFDARPAQGEGKRGEGFKKFAKPGGGKPGGGKPGKPGGKPGGKFRGKAGGKPGGKAMGKAGDKPARRGKGKR